MAVDWGTVIAAVIGAGGTLGGVVPIILKTVNATAQQSISDLKERTVILEAGQSEARAENARLSEALKALKTENDTLKRYANFSEVPPALKDYMDRHHADIMEVLNGVRAIMGGVAETMRLLTHWTEKQ